VSINKGPYERIFKLATIKIYTAGSSFSDIKITGLQEDVAEQIKTFILQQNAASEQL
jgi:membrane protein YdbS with pleckstrin-like domain